MKTLIVKMKKVYAKAKGYVKQMVIFLTDTWGMIRSVWIVCFRNIKKPGVFYGHYSYKLAQAYARKRDRRWKPKWDQNGKIQGMFPLGDTKIIICSRMEVKRFQKLGMISKIISANKFFKKANYYKTKNYYGNTKQSR